MKRHIELDDVDFTRLVWGLGMALATLKNVEMPIAAQQMGELASRIEQESTLVPDDADD